MENTSSSGIGFTGLLTIVFVTLKLLDYITWSWWWVVSPIWIPIVLLVGGFIIFVIVKGFVVQQNKRKFEAWRENLKN